VIDPDSITPPPSLADILSSGEDLIGRVDFGSRLGAEPRSERAGTTATRTRAPRAEALPAPSAGEAPPAPVEEVAESAPRKRGTRRAKAALRPALERVASSTDEAEPVDDEAPALPVASQVEPEADLDVEADSDADVTINPVVEARSFTEPPSPVGAFTDQDDEYDDRDDLQDDQQVDRGEPTTAYAEPPTRDAARPPGRVAPRRELPELAAPSVVPEEDVAYLGMSVEEVAESARARMRAAEVAHLRHLEAIENEAARRLELLTAQAELDAELIRLHARREAHAIVSAARTRAGGAAGASRAERRLAEVGSTFARFAETLESSIESTTAPDHRHHP
jgi:hypothetical protein